jgi:hypothetical protein
VQSHHGIAVLGEGVGRRGQAGRDPTAGAAMPAAGMQAAAGMQGGGAALPVAVGGERAARLGQVVVGGTRCGGGPCELPCDDAESKRPRVQPGRGASSGGAISPRLLTFIKSCTSPDELLSLVDQHGQAFDHIHAAAEPLC